MSVKTRVQQYRPWCCPAAYRPRLLPPATTDSICVCIPNQFRNTAVSCCCFAALRSSSPLCRYSSHSGVPCFLLTCTHGTDLCHQEDVHAAPATTHCCPPPPEIILLLQLFWRRIARSDPLLDALIKALVVFYDLHASTGWQMLDELQVRTALLLCALLLLLVVLHWHQI